jgi:hypothetical protein
VARRCRSGSSRQLGDADDLRRRDPLPRTSRTRRWGCQSASDGARDRPLQKASGRQSSHRHPSDCHRRRLSVRRRHHHSNSHRRSCLRASRCHLRYPLLLLLPLLLVDSRGRLPLLLRMSHRCYDRRLRMRRLPRSHLLFVGRLLFGCAARRRSLLLLGAQCRRCGRRRPNYCRQYLKSRRGREMNTRLLRHQRASCRPLRCAHLPSLLLVAPRGLLGSPRQRCGRYLWRRKRLLNRLPLVGCSL